jgi:hypothetical protein
MILTSILLDLAGEVAAPFVKKVLGDKLGDAGGKLAGSVVDVIAGKLGVPASKIPDQPREVVQAAIVAAEPEVAELVLAHVEQQRAANELQMAEMDKGPLWTWAWRPVWMWLLGFLWVWQLVVVHITNAAFGTAIPVASTGDLFNLTGAYLALYLGGHTAKNIWGQK